ncbi:MAG TPA: anti-sigma factor [Candidatus Eremiobacteraceae bacterium]|nr:anti-sigma factor [Candidatus Eremiobacteraceae bacterium]
MMDARDQAMRELAELYALGGLEPEERAAVEAYLKDPGCQDALVRGRLAAFALASSVATPPPPGLRERVLAIAKTKPATQTPSTAQPAPRVIPIRPAFWRQPGWLAAAAAVVLIVFATTWAIESGKFGARTWAVQCAAVAPCGISGRVVAANGGQTLRLEAHGFQPAPSGKVYQAWYIRPGAKPTPAPTFTPDANGDASVVLPVGAEKGLTVAVTVEPEGGSLAPTTKPFLVASIQ